LRAHWWAQLYLATLIDQSLDFADVVVATPPAFHQANIAPATAFDYRQRGWLSVTALVVAYPPESLATFLGDGGYLPRSVPLMKRILALPGQTACRTSLTITANGIDTGAAR
jgi:type IV secretory pathway protease TraF